ncbi:MAG: DUF1624 domain-containing protein [Aeromonadaceae bacterium]|nr:DUF1624 domain-containing protein [Aeromonadaceae bacterium]
MSLPAVRLPWLDQARGIAILAMMAFHTCFDLTYWQLASFNMLADGRWIWTRNLIVTLFLAIMGINLVLGQGQGRRHFWRRLARIGAAALLISVVTWFMFGERFIYFGVLHFVVVATLLASLLRHWLSKPWLWVALGLLCLLAGLYPGLEAMDPRYLNWIGLTTHKPPTEDYVPLLPWLGVVLLGMALGTRLASTPVTPPLPTSRPGKGLAWMGRHSLLIYLLHQPLLMGLLGLLAEISNKIK